MDRDELEARRLAAIDALSTGDQVKRLWAGYAGPLILTTALVLAVIAGWAVALGWLT
jgi:hypothetical protein